MNKTILITGASRGFGKIWTEAFLKQGYKVAATARNVDSLNHLVEEYGESVLPLQLDVTNRDQCFEVVSKVQQRFGKIDVLINNAGYGLFGTIEEASEKEARDQFETNVFGTLWMTQAVIPVMRNQGSGHIVQLSSVLGVATVPLMGLYNATKFAIEGLTETMATEIQAFGIKTTLVEPIAYTTDFSTASGVISSNPIALYEEFKKAVFEQFRTMPNGDPSATADVILKVVEAENSPTRIFFGKTALPWVKQVYADRLLQWEQVVALSNEAHG